MCVHRCVDRYVYLCACVSQVCAHVHHAFWGFSSRGSGVTMAMTFVLLITSSWQPWCGRQLYLSPPDQCSHPGGVPCCEQGSLATQGSACHRRTQFRPQWGGCAPVAVNGDSLGPLGSLCHRQRPSPRVCGPRSRGASPWRGPFCAR